VTYRSFWTIAGALVAVIVLVAVWVNWPAPYESGPAGVALEQDNERREERARDADARA
jgi:hypothetical protein